MLKKSVCIGQPFKTAARDPCRSETLTGAGDSVPALSDSSEKAFVPAQFSLLISLRKKSFIFSIFSQNSNDFLREMGYTINVEDAGPQPRLYT